MAVTITITSPTGSEFDLAEWFAAADLDNPLSTTANEYYLDSNGSFLNGRVELHFKSTGNDLTFDGNNIPSGGVLDFLEVYSVALGQVVATVTGFSYNAYEFYLDVSGGYSEAVQFSILLSQVTYTGDEGADQFVGGTNFDNISGGKGDDVLDGNIGGGTISGGEGNDILKGSYDTTLDGGEGDDVLYDAMGTHFFIGGDGFDTLSFENTALDAQGKYGVQVIFNGTLFAEGYLESYTSIEKIIGSAFDDTIDDGDDSMLLEGAAGKDLISGGKGDDWINGGSGADKLDGGEGTDTLNYTGATIAVTLTLGAAGAEKTGSGGDAAGDKFKNFENIIGGNGGDALSGNELGNILFGGLGKDKLSGFAGNDRILGGEENDTIDGGVGDDLLDGGAGADKITGNGGFDTVTYVNSSAAVTVNLATNVNKGGDAEGDKLFTVEKILGSSKDDDLTGNGAHTLEGGAGADKITGKLNDYASYLESATAVTVDLNVVTQTSAGDAGGDQLTGILNLIGSALADKLTGNNKDNIFQGLLGADIIDGGLGIDTLDYSASHAGVNVILGVNGDGTGFGGHAEGDQFTGIENIVATEFADSLLGNQLANKIAAGKGDDEIDGGGGADIIDGGEGVDAVYYDTSDFAVTVNLATNVNKGGNAEGEKLSGIENLGGSDFADKLTGNTGANSINGGANDDIVDGGAGTDILFGGSGKDTVFGNAGDDFISGNADADTLDGGAGIDTLTYAGAGTLVRVKLSEGAVAQVQTGALTVNGVNVNLGNGDASDDSVKNFENLVGGGFNDVLVGNGGVNSIFGGNGNDNIEGGKGNDIIEGGDGADTLSGGAGLTADADAGIDSLSYASDTTGVSVNLATGATNFGHAAGDVIVNFRNILGGKSGDTLRGDGAANTISGAAGNDLLSGGGGKDILDGGSDADVVDYSMVTDGITFKFGVNGAQTSVTGKAGGEATGDAIKNVESIYGSTGNDVITGNALNNEIFGHDGDDLIQGGAGQDYLEGGFIGTDTSLNDTISYAASLAGVEVVLNSIATAGIGGDAEGDTILGFENIIGSAKNDVLISLLPNQVNSIKGGAGDDIIVGGEEGDMLFGEAGSSDTLSYETDSFGVTVTLKGAAAADVAGSVNMFNHAKGDIATGFENLVGGSGMDKLTGDNGANVIRGSTGADKLDGAGGVDTVSYADYSTSVTLVLGVNGAETFASVDGDSVMNFENIIGSSEADELTGNNLVNVLSGGFGDDILKGGAGADTLDGGDGIDTADYSDLTAAQGIVVTLGANGALKTVTSSAGSPAAGDKLIGIENVKGGAGNDKFTGNELSNVFHGNDGDDYFNGGIAGDGFFGGNGSDTVNYAASDAGVNVNLDSNNASGGYADNDNISSIENLIGSAFNDVLIGNAEANTLTGGGGNDTIINGGGVGADILDGGTDSPNNKTFISVHGDLLDFTSLSDVDITITLGANGAQTIAVATGANAAFVNGDKISNFESIWSTNGNDVLTGNNLSNSIFGGIGDDLIEGGGGDDILQGGGGVDTLSYAGATIGVTVKLNDSNPQNTVGAGIDLIGSFYNLIGSSKADRLTGDSVDNKIEGGVGDDIIRGAGGEDTLIGGAGINTVSYEDGGNVIVDLGVQDGVTGQIGSGGDETGDILSGFQNLIGSDAPNNKLTGNAEANVIKGLGGFDLIQGRGGADTLDGGDDIDLLSYEADVAGVTVTLGLNGAQTIVKGGEGEGDKVANFEWIRGGSGNDTLTGNNLDNEIYGGAGADIIDGGGGDDFLNGEGGVNTVSYASATMGVTVNLNIAGAQNTVGAGNDNLSNFHQLIGSSKNDVLTGANNTTLIDGGAGDDKITGSTVMDQLFGGDGNDTLIGGGNGDTLEGGAGNDTIDGGATTQDTASYAGSKAAVTVNLQLSGSAQNTVGAGKDTLIGIEHLTGSKFNDTLTGDGNDNNINGGDGADTIVASGGFDGLTGGLGNDTFRFNNISDGADHIYDFTTGDKIQISKSGFGIPGSVTLNASGVNNFASEYFISGSGVVADKAHGQFVFDTFTSRLYWDADGAGGNAHVLVADLENNHNLLATEFTLI